MRAFTLLTAFTVSGVLAAQAISKDLGVKLFLRKDTCSPEDDTTCASDETCVLDDNIDYTCCPTTDVECYTSLEPSTTTAAAKSTTTKKPVTPTPPPYNPNTFPRVTFTTNPRPNNPNSTPPPRPQPVTTPQGGQIQRAAAARPTDVAYGIVAAAVAVAAAL